MWDQPGQCCQPGTSAHSEECSRFGSVLPAPAAGDQSSLLEVMKKSLGGSSFTFIFPFLTHFSALFAFHHVPDPTNEKAWVDKRKFLEGCCCCAF